MSDEKDTSAVHISAFERKTKRVFDESVAGLDAATRSRLTQARYRALEQLDASGAHAGSWWRLTGRRNVLAPVGAMAAVVALTTVLWVGRPGAGRRYARARPSTIV